MINTTDKIVSEILSKKPLSKENIILGRKKFCTNFEKIELDITFDCNLKCKNCNRSCGEAPSKEYMSLEQINNFIQESKTCGRKYKLIKILGGEPTIHPDFETIVEALQKDYADSFNPDVIIQIVSNGFTKESRDLCDKVEKLFKNVRIDRESYKTNSNVDYFTAFADAPVDDSDFNNSDFSMGCWVSEFCGIGLNKNGYFGCSVCGAIDRVLKTGKGVHKIEELTPAVQEDQFKSFCGLCGNFKCYSQNYGDFVLRCEKAPFRHKISKTWEKIYRDYNNE